MKRDGRVGWCEQGTGCQDRRVEGRFGGAETEGPDYRLRGSYAFLSFGGMGERVVW